jgi:hypothetical protein
MVMVDGEGVEVRGLVNGILELLAYADDLALGCTSREGLQNQLNRLNEACDAVGLKISDSKTEVMTQNTVERGQIHLNGKILKEVDHFVYLGGVQSRDGKSTKAIEYRISKASKAFWQLRGLWRSNLSMHLKGRLYTTLIRSILLYGAGTWTTTSDDQQALETFDMQCIRSILQTSRILHIRSVMLRSRLGIDSSIFEEVRRARLRLFGHVCRMEDGRIPRSLMESGYRLPQVRPGRPQMTWHHCIEKDLEFRGEGFYSARRLAIKSRAKYREHVVYGQKPVF